MPVDLTKLSCQQLEAVELLATGAYKYTEVAEKIGVHRTSLYQWRKQPVFVQAITERARELIQESLPEIYKALTTNAVNGNNGSIKLVLEHLERLEELQQEAAESNITFTWDA